MQNNKPPPPPPPAPVPGIKKIPPPAKPKAVIIPIAKSTFKVKPVTDRSSKTAVNSLTVKTVNDPSTKPRVNSLSKSTSSKQKLLGLPVSPYASLMPSPPQSPRSSKTPSPLPLLSKTPSPLQSPSVKSVSHPPKRVSIPVPNPKAKDESKAAAPTATAPNSEKPPKKPYQTNSLKSIRNLNLKPSLHVWQPGYGPDTHWRKHHSDHIKRVRTDKSEYSNLDPDAIPNELPFKPLEFVKCPHCGREFDQKVAERHIAACEKMEHNKSKKGTEPPKKSDEKKNQTDEKKNQPDEKKNQPPKPSGVKKK